jgi:hypothetical protein
MCCVVSQMMADRIAELLFINPYYKRVYKLWGLELNGLSGSRVYGFFCECLKVYKNTYKKHSLTYIEKHTDCIKRSKYKTLAVTLSVYARWCLEYEYSRIGFMMFPFDHDHCVACCVDRSDDCLECCLLKYCNHASKKCPDTDDRLLYIKTHMLEWFRDGLLEELSSYGADYAWEWLPYFEDSTLDSEV